MQLFQHFNSRNKQLKFLYDDFYQYWLQQFSKTGHTNLDSSHTHMMAMHTHVHSEANWALPAGIGDTVSVRDLVSFIFM